MNIQHSSSSHPVVQAFKNLISKLVQNPEVYPIKYYRKNHRNKKRWPEVK